MNYTEKYHLPQWEETDRIMRTDFNQMCADMEAGLNSNASAAGKAQAAANAAQAKANAAYSPSQKPYAVGTYRGLGVEAVNIELGFKPSFIIIAKDITLAITSTAGGYVYAGGETMTSMNRITFHSTGFTLAPDGGKEYFPSLNSGGDYHYIAFR